MGGAGRRRSRRPSFPSGVLDLTKLIFWLVGLLIAIVTMNVTVYLALSAVWFGVRTLRQVARRRLAESLEEARDRLLG